MMYRVKVPSRLLRVQARFGCLIACAGRDLDEHLLLTGRGEAKIGTGEGSGDSVGSGVHSVESDERVPISVRWLLLEGSEGLERMRELRNKIAPAIRSVATKDIVSDYLYVAAVTTEVEEDVRLVKRGERNAEDAGPGGCGHLDLSAVIV